MTSFSSATDDAHSDQDSRHPSLSASSQASSAGLRRTSRLSSTAGIFDLEDDGVGAGSSSGRRASNNRVSSLGSSSNHGSVAERGSRDLFDVLEEESHPPTSSPPLPTSTSGSSSKAAGRSSQLSLDNFGKYPPTVLRLLIGNAQDTRRGRCNSELQDVSKKTGLNSTMFMAMGSA
uniref:Related to serine threonine protein kinase n=1 Tax=Melanopsichium pennsylvanicum 4 TaxID=1398559 RepID=A0A077R5T0_9BASI|nr:related to serine threonine protein kinase [Melanopsichium pennsylvanicum 4]